MPSRPRLSAGTVIVIQKTLGVYSGSFLGAQPVVASVAGDGRRPISLGSDYSAEASHIANNCKSLDYSDICTENRRLLLRKDAQLGMIHISRPRITDRHQFYAACRYRESYRER